MTKKKDRLIQQKIHKLDAPNPMYEELNDFERALSHFGTRVELICAMELAGKITPEEAYQRIKSEIKSVKRIRKTEDKGLSKL